MHPAPSLVLFTTAAGAGYGLLFLLGVAAPLGLLPVERWFGVVALGLALGLVSIGLAASTYHLGHPERAWRAVSQWRSSWLSREGVAALATYAVAAPFALGWVIWQSAAGPWAAFALLSAAGALTTTACTGMIYASLRTIRQWHTPWVPVLFLAFALATGAVSLAAVARLFAVGTAWIEWLAMGALVLAWAVQVGYWHATGPSSSATTAKTTAKTATGLGHLGRVQALEAPHTEDNYLLREMGYRIARRHARRLRRLALLAGLPLPVALVLAARVVPGGADAAGLVLAAVLTGIGVATARWLFFAEAKHTQALYYGRDEP